MSATGPLAPWGGLLAGLFAWFANQQIGVLLVPWSCETGRATPILGLGFAALLLAAGGFWLSWRVWRTGAAAETEPGAGTRRFVGALGAGLAALFGLAIIAQMMAALVLSGCER